MCVLIVLRVLYLDYEIHSTTFASASVRPSGDLSGWNSDLGFAGCFYELVIAEEYSTPGFVHIVDLDSYL